MARIPKKMLNTNTKQNKSQSHDHKRKLLVCIKDKFYKYVNEKIDIIN